MGNNVWGDAPPSVITNAPVNPSDKEQFRVYTEANLKGVVCKRNDALTIYGIAINECNKGLSFEQGIYGKTYGAIGDVNTSVYKTSVNYQGIADTDKVPQGADKGHVFAANRKPANPENFFNVKNSPYDAKGDGVTDDAQAIQSALDAASSAGGGTVFLPPGIYKVSTHLSVPSGVELRGSLDYRFAHNVMLAKIEKCTL